MTITSNSQMNPLSNPTLMIRILWLSNHYKNKWWTCISKSHTLNSHSYLKIRVKISIRWEKSREAANYGTTHNSPSLLFTFVSMTCKYLISERLLDFLTGLVVLEVLLELWHSFLKLQRSSLAINFSSVLCSRTFSLLRSHFLARVICKGDRQV